MTSTLDSSEQKENELGASPAAAIRSQDTGYSTQPDPEPLDQDQHTGKFLFRFNYIHIQRPTSKIYFFQ